MIVSMQKVKLIFLESDKEQILNELQMHALFMPDKKHFKSVTPSEDLIRVSKAIEIIERYLKKSTGNNAIVTKSEFELLDQHSLELAANILDLQNTYYKLQETQKSLKEKYEELLPYKNLSVSQSRIETLRFTQVVLGFIQKEKYDAFKGHMDTLGAYVDILSSDDNYHYVSILIDKDQSDRLEDLLESMDFNIEPNRNYDKTNMEVITDLNSELESIEKEMKETEQFFIDSSKDLGGLKLLHDQLLSKESKLQIELLSTETTVYVEGWVRGDQVEDIKSILNDKNFVFELEARDALSDESVPTALKNNRFVKPYEYITNQFSTPSASEVDPNPSMSFWYWLIFGIMMGDIGYGLVMIVAFSLLLKFGKLRGATKDLVKIFCYSGVTSIGAGILFGSFFGATIFTPLLDPINDPVPMLIISLILGVVHIVHGLILKLVNSYRQKDILGGLNDAGSWIFILVGLSLFITATFIPLESLIQNILLYTSYVLMGLGVLIIILLNGREQKSIPGKIVSAIAGLYNSTSYLSDILSYSRILALSLSTAVIAYTMNLLGEMVWGSIPVLGILLGIIIYLIGHVFNFIMGMLSAYVHAGRLQYLEFYGKFFEGGGYLFEPFSLQLKYVYQVNLKENKEINKEN